MLILGVVVSSLSMPPILNLLNDAYGFGANGLLPAPQASLMMTVSEGVIMGGLPWGWVGAGALTALIVIVSDRTLKYYSIPFGLPVLGFAVGYCKKLFSKFSHTFSISFSPTRSSSCDWCSNHVLFISLSHPNSTQDWSSRLRFYRRKSSRGGKLRCALCWRSYHRRSSHGNIPCNSYRHQW